MAVTGVSNLSELISNQSSGQDQSAPGGALPIQPQGAGQAGPTQDTFTPSSQNISAPVTAQDAGLFQASQFALGAATAELLTTQTAAPQTPQEIAPAQAVQTGTTDAVLVPAPQIPAAPAAPATAAATPIAAAALLATNAIEQGEPQIMNAELLGLGLSNSDIQTIDRIASVAKNYNPLVYNDLIQQFEAQAAQQDAPAVATNPPATQGKLAGT